MFHDLARGALTEIDALCGVVVREGEKLGVPTPVNEYLWQRVREKEGRPLPSPPPAAASLRGTSGKPNARLPDRPSVPHLRRDHRKWYSPSVGAAGEPTTWERSSRTAA